MWCTMSIQRKFVEGVDEGQVNLECEVDLIKFIKVEDADKMQSQFVVRGRFNESSSRSTGIYDVGSKYTMSVQRKSIEGEDDYDVDEVRYRCW